MKLIDRLTTDPYQRTFLTGLKGERIVLELRFLPTQSLWIADITRGDFAVKGISLVVSVNLLRQYLNIIDFGLTVSTEDGQDPRTLEDFQTGYAKLYLMSKEEADYVEEIYFE